MSVAGKTLAKNTTFYITALTLQKVLSFAYFSYLARSLGTEQTGKYFFALSVAALVMVFTDLGLTPLLTRDIAKDTTRASPILSTILSFKTLLTLVAGLAVFGLAPLMSGDQQTIQLLYIAFLISVTDSFALTFFATIRAHLNLAYESVASILFYVIVIAFGVTAIQRGAELRIIILALLIAGLFNMLFAWWTLHYRYRVKMVWSLSYATIYQLWIHAMPFALAAIFVKVYAYIDTIILNFLMGAHEVGLYSVAYKITFAFQFLPMAFVATLYPAYAYFWQHEQSRVALLFSRAMLYLLILALPITAGLVALVPRIIPVLYTEAYGESVAPLIVLLFSLPFLFVNFPIGSLLNACHRQSRQTWHLGITMALNIILNLFLIPVWGAFGAAVASTVSTVFIFFLGMYVVHQVTPLEFRRIGMDVLKLVLIAILLYCLVAAIASRIPWYLSIPPAIVFYALGLYFLKIINLGDVRQFRSIIRR